MKSGYAFGVAIFCALSLAACNESPTPINKTSTVAPRSEPPAVVTAQPAPSATGLDASGTAKDSPETHPMRTLSKEEESKSMPMAGQANNHSSPSLEESGRK